MILKIVAKTNTDLSQLQGTVNQLKNENISTQKQIADLENKIEYLENQTRRNNIVIYGVPEDDRETWEATEIKATDIIKNYIKVDISGADVERAHRIGKKVDNEERPIIVRFVNYKYKERILKCAKNLAGTRFAVTENFSARILQQRKLLKPYLMEAKKAGKRAHLKYNKLIIEGKPFKNNKLIIEGKPFTCADLVQDSTGTVNVENKSLLHMAEVLKSSGATQQSMGSVGDGGATSSGLVTRMDVSEQVATRSKSGRRQK
ncbi:hypothetical protein QE152_g5574 [Popillia japonica]|uniref:Uncharacterized protein n=1 Tax=Popillia japonica TaxID=7064 RepID=A0AAW1MM43_POPJA